MDARGGGLEDHAGRPRATKNQGDVAPALASAAKSLTASYELPFMKHAPIGPTIAVGDARADGTVFVHTHNQNPQALRGQIAMMLGTPVDNVVVRIYAGPGPLRPLERRQRRRRGRGGACCRRRSGGRCACSGCGPRICSGRPQSPPAVSNIRIGWDASGKITAYEADHYMPAMQDDRLVGALLAGLPTPPAPDVERAAGSIGSTVNAISGSVDLRAGAERRRDRASARFRSARRRRRSAIGLRDHSMRTPGQLQQNFPRELAISEAAAQAGIDAIEFRLRQTDDARLRRRAEGGARGLGLADANRRQSPQRRGRRRHAR